jgi:hypothetical protein
MSYSNAKIYTIKCKNDDKLIYVGSTIQPLSVRWGGHKAVCKMEKHKNRLIYKTINEKWDDWEINLYEEYPCENKEQLKKREGEVIREIGSLNTKIEGRTQKEYYDNKQESILKQKKVYYYANRDKILEHKKVYYIDNKNIISFKNKARYIHKKNINNPISCPSCTLEQLQVI